MNVRAASFRSRIAGGFTIVEVLVAAGITALIAGFIAAIVASVSTSWSRLSTRLGTDAQARLILDQIQLDLQGAIFREDGNTWFAADILNGASGGATGMWIVAPRNPKPVGGISLNLTAPSIAQARFGTAGTWLRFFTSGRPVTNAAGAVTIPSAPVAVSYQIIRRYTATNPANTNTGYLLHRAEARPGATGTSATARPGVLESGYSITAAAYTTSPSSTNSGAVLGDPRSVQVPGAVRTLDMVFGDNVIDFGIRAYVRDATAPGGLRLIFPATTAGALTNSPQPLASRLPSNTPSSASGYNPRLLFPDVVDVMVRILTDAGVEEITNLEKVQTPALSVPQKYNNNAQQWWWGVAEENSRVYTRRVVINAEPL